MEQVITDPTKINDLAKQFMDEPSELTSITTQMPNNNEIFLPGGFINSEDILVKTATIRELTGSDEEAIASTSSVGRALETIFKRGLVTLGDETPTNQDLDTLLAGDRESILVGIRISTFGATIPFKATCACGEHQELEFNLEEDLKTEFLDDPINDRVFTVTGKAGEFKVGLPNGVTTKRLLDIENAAFPELVTALLSGCLISVNDEPSLGKSTALGLGMSDRELLANEIYKRNPGPRLGEVSKACKACGTEILLSLSLADLFRL
jgi:hypothetical protein